MRLKEFTSFDVAAAVRELKATLVDSRVNNIYQLQKKTLLFKLHKSDQPAFRLVLEAGNRLNLTAYAPEKTPAPSSFCMALRKYLRNAWLTDVAQCEFERVVLLCFKSRSDILRLVCEMFGDGNIILVGDDSRILQALTYKRMRDRDIVRGEIFRFPPPFGKNPFKISKQEFLAGMQRLGDVEVVRALARFLGVGGIYAEEILLTANIEKTKLCIKLMNDELSRVFDALQSLLERVSTGKLEPQVILDEKDAFVDVIPFELKRYESLGFKHRVFSSFNEALDEFYIRVSSVEQVASDEVVEGLKREAERLDRMVVDQEKVLREAEVDAERNRRIGDIIYAHEAELQTLLRKFSADKREGRELKTIANEILREKAAGSLSPFESLDAKNLMLTVRVNGLTFELDPRKTLFDNAAFYYERSKKARLKLEGVKTALSDTRKKSEEIREKIQKAETVRLGKPAEIIEELEKRKVRQKEWFEKFRWSVSSDGSLFVAGKDAVTNEVLVKKHAENNDVVFHADIVGAPFVVLKTEGKAPSTQCLREAAEFAAAFSRAWREGFGAVDVYHVKPEQLSKGGPSGESVGHGAFVVRGERNWHRGTSLKLAIGVVSSDNSICFVGGPVNAVQAKTNAYVIIVPGNIAGKELYRHILTVLAEKASKEDRQKVLKASVEQIRDFVPFGKARILEA